MSEFHCKLIPYYVYKPLPFSIVDTDYYRFKFKISEDEFKKFNTKYKDVLDWYDGPSGESTPGEKEYSYRNPRFNYISCYYKYSPSRSIWIYYVPSLCEIKFVVFHN